MQPRPSLHDAAVHWTVSPQLWLPVQVTSHAHEAPHDTVLHELGPLHVTAHLLVPHTTPSQDD